MEEVTVKLNAHNLMAILSCIHAVEDAYIAFPIQKR